MATLKFKGKAPELIKIAIAVGAESIFFDVSNDYEPIWFDSEQLEYFYGSQIFTDVENQKNMIWTDTPVTGDCLQTTYDFIGYEIWLLETGYWNDSAGNVWADESLWVD